jgi:hypothetical protein
MKFMLCLARVCAMGLFGFVLSATKTAISRSITKLMLLIFSCSANIGVAMECDSLQIAG